MSRYIDADALKVSYCKQCLKETGNEQIEVKQTPYCAVACQDFDVIDKQPTINAVPVRYGKWIPNNPFTGNCSECGSESNMKDKYCPNCGAKMNGKE